VALQRPGGGNAVQLRQPQIHQHDVGLQLLSDAQSLLAILFFSNHVDLLS
jgi:hypothetical protein